MGMCCSLSDTMGMGDGRQETQPEFTPRLMMTVVQSQAVAEGNSRSMLTLRRPARWKEEQGEERRGQGRETGRARARRAELNLTKLIKLISISR